MCTFFKILRYRIILPIALLIRKICESKAASHCLLFALFFIVAAASHSGFIAKWGLIDSADPANITRNSIEAMLDGSAHKPFVYRQFVPWLANSADSYFSTQTKTFIVKNFQPQKHYVNVISSERASYEFRYRVVYVISFVSFLISLYLLRAIILQTSGGQIEAVLAPTAFLLAFPYLQTVGGYFYDGVELAFLSGSVLAVIKKEYIIFLIVSAIAVYNKESFLLFLPTLYPLLRHDLDKKKSVVVLLPALAFSLVINLLIKFQFTSNKGGSVEVHILENIKNYLQPWTYNQLEMTYGLPGPKGAYFVTVLLVVLISFRSWPSLPARFKHHIGLCFLINLPLFILFCATGELRNLSLLYVGFVLLLSFAFHQKTTGQASFNSPNKTDG